MMDFAGKPPTHIIARAVRGIPERLRRQEPAASTPSAAHRGQILIMFALFLTGLLGAVGLSVDLGMAFSQRRTMQSSADAGAYAGAWAVLKSKAVQSEVNTIVNQNKMSLGAITSIKCDFVNDAKQSLGDCGGAIPGGASGVRVTVTEAHPTFFIRVVPGAPNNVTTSATATANIKLVKTPGGGPFLPCSQKAIRADNGQTMDLVFLDSNFNLLGVNPAAYGVKFNIYAPQRDKPTGSNTNSMQDCGIATGNYNGAADQTAPCTPVPGWCSYKTGSYTGPVNQAVAGVDGCNNGATSPYNCVAFLPIATEKDQPIDPSVHEVWVVTYLPFYIEQGDQPNKYFGTLLKDYVLSGNGEDGTGGWAPGTQGPVTIRLTE